MTQTGECFHPKEVDDFGGEFSHQPTDQPAPFSNTAKESSLRDLFQTPTLPANNQDSRDQQARKPTCPRDQQPRKTNTTPETIWLKRPVSDTTTTCTMHIPKNTPLKKQTPEHHSQHPQNTNTLTPKYPTPSHTTKQTIAQTTETKAQSHTTQTKSKNTPHKTDHTKQTTAHTTKQRPKTTPPRLHHKLYWLYFVGFTSAVLWLGRSIAPDNPVMVHPQLSPAIPGWWQHVVPWIWVGRSLRQTKSWV
jgi:hypothetical protein